MSTVSTLYDYGDRPGTDWFLDMDGVPTTSKREEEIKSYTVDLADTLATGETISSVSHTASGITVNSSSNSTTTYSAVITGTGGELKSTITTSSSRKLVRLLRFLAIDRVTTDYR